MDKATIGKALRAAREKAGMSVNKAARALGAGYERVKALEEGRGSYGIDVLLSYAEIVGLRLITVDAAAVVAAPVEKKEEKQVVMHKPVQAAGDDGVKKKKKVIIEEAD